MVEDIVPGLLKTIRRNFKLKTSESELLRKALIAAKNNEATYEDASSFAVEIGKILADVLSSDLSSAVLPDGKLYYNIGSRILNETLKTNYDLVTGYTTDVQNQLNVRAGIGLKAQTPAFNQDRVDGIVNRLSSEENLDDVSWLLKDPIVNFTQSIVDDSVRANAEFQSKAGLHPTITRRLVGKGCAWCRRLAGTYDYEDAPQDIYRRHENDRCIVEYDPGSGKQQNVWTKKWKDAELDDKIKTRTKALIKQTDPGSVLKMDLQLFSERDLAKQSATSLRRGIRKLQQGVAEHEEKIRHPENYIDDWSEWPLQRQQGLRKHWQKEIDNFKASISNRTEELLKRGEKYDD
ncbi:hypothetical protein U7537_04605 [Lacticaseibacillus rhamnosus]